MVTENKPWATYLRVSDTGTDTTGDTRVRIGFEHNQFTGRDDILQVDVMTGDPSELFAGFARYEAPLGKYRRLRWQVSVTGSDYDAEDFGIRGANFHGTSTGFGARLVANVYQRGNLFLDFLGGVRWDHIENDNELARIEGEDDFFLPSAALRLERRSAKSRLFALVELEGNISGIAGTDTDDVDKAGGLGRFNADDDFVLLRWDASSSTYFSPPNELYVRLGGQWAFDNRLVPNYERAAGGIYTVRGYDQASIAADSVFLGTVEYRRHFPQFFSQKPWNLMVRAFGDAARVLYSDRLRFEVHETLASAGVGAELHWRRNLSLRGDIGWVLEDSLQLGVEQGDTRGHFSVTAIY